MNIKIRKTNLEDMKAVEDAHRRSIQNICSKDYTSHEIEKFSAVKYSTDIWENSIHNDYHIVIERDGIIEGMCHAKMNDNRIGEIVGLYITDKVIGTGCGRKLTEMAFEYLLKFNPIKITLTGTKTAKPFYEKMGFKEIEEKIVDIRGAQLTCYQMEKKIDV